MTSELRIYVLRFAERASLARAFDHVSGHAEIPSCSLELPELCIRLLARPTVVEPLLVRFTLEGGLRWCSRHAFEHAAFAPAGASGRAAGSRE